MTKSNIAQLLYIDLFLNRVIWLRLILNQNNNDEDIYQFAINKENKI